ncbi:unnamed protein product, partial [Polarella glacialis]
LPPGYLKSMCPASTCSSTFSSFTSTAGLLNTTNISVMRAAGVERGAGQKMVGRLEALQARQKPGLGVHYLGSEPATRLPRLAEGRSQ